MAAARLRNQAPVGSAQWIQSERTQANEFVEQEVEEFTFAARNEMEWLNEHMAEIFTRGEINVAEIFKTPGKLRGKTPRTAVKRNPLETRAPLGDLFAPNSQAFSSPPKTEFQKKLVNFQVAADENTTSVHNSPVKAPQKHAHIVSPEKEKGKTTTSQNSGYHGISEDEMVVDSVAQPEKEIHHDTSPEPAEQQVLQVEETPAVEARRFTDESFVSAEEELAKRRQTGEEPIKADLPVMPIEEAEQDEEIVETHSTPSKTPLKQRLSAIPRSASPLKQIAATKDVEMEDAPEEEEEEPVQSPSVASSPAKPLVRKSSLNFASLPAREPFAKKSMGPRNSRTSHLDQVRTTQYGRFTGGKSLGGQQLSQPTPAEPEAEPEKEMIDVDEFPAPPAQEESEAAKLHNKTSTQRLHDRINMLGQSKEAPLSKAVPSLAPTTQPTYPTLPRMASQENVRQLDAPQPPPKDVPSAVQDEDDWIAPIKPAETSKPAAAENASSCIPQSPLKTMASAAFQIPERASSRQPSASPTRPPHIKANSVATLPSPSKLQMAPQSPLKKTVSVSNPSIPPPAVASVTPAGSPTSKKHTDGILSAAKAKLNSGFKTARGLFTSAASLSAQAKTETLSPAANRSRPALSTQVSAESVSQVSSPSKSLYPDLQSVLQKVERPASVVSSPSKNGEGRRTRSSSERERAVRKQEKEAEERHKAQDKLDKAREKEREKAAVLKAREQIKAQARAAEEARQADEEMHDEMDVDSAEEMPPPPPPKNAEPQIQKPNTRMRIAKPPSKETLARAQPVPVAVRVGSQIQRIGQVAPSAFGSSQRSDPPVAPPSARPQRITSKSSTTSLNTASTVNSYKSAASSASTRPKALESAQKKREQEEKLAQKKAEQKRELEAKRAAKVEEERRKAEEERRAEQQRKAAEQKRLIEARQAAQRQAEEQKRKAEQQRAQASRPATRLGNHDLGTALQNEAKQQAQHPRPVGKTLQEMNKPMREPMINPAKPAKRVFHPDDDDEPVIRVPASKAGASYQQQDAKRRKTDEFEEQPEPIRSVNAPPIRLSNMQKGPSKFPSGYMPAGQPGSSMFKAAVTNQHNLQHPSKSAYPTPNDMAKFANGKIPFAGAPTPGPSHHNPHKTPLRVVNSPKNRSSPRPQRPNGDDIVLPEIQTDSEDSDSDSDSGNGGPAFNPPSWVNSPALREALTQQQMVDPETIFGPIAKLDMESVFSEQKDRHKRFRNRTSSANWRQDMVTEEERRRDREARERVAREGGWRMDSYSVRE